MKPHIKISVKIMLLAFMCLCHIQCTVNHKSGNDSLVDNNKDNGIDSGNTQISNSAPGTATINQNISPVQIEMNGAISTTYKPSEEAKITFDRFPVNYKDWTSLQPQLGNSLAGTIALEIMAIQLYYYDQVEGEKAIRACNTESDASGLIRNLKEKFRSSLAGKGDSYACPWLIASYLSGSKPENAYHPTRPYEIVVRMNPTQKPQEGRFSFTGMDYYLQIYCNGADTPWRGVEVADLKDEEYFKVFNSASLAVGVKQISYNSNPSEFEELH